MIEDSELAQSLLESGLVDRDRLMEVARHRTAERNLYHTLLSYDAVEERALVRLAGKLLNVPSVRLDRIVIAPEVLDLVPASMANRNKVIPLSIEQDGPHKRLVLGMIDPIDVLAMDEVSTHTGIDIRPVLVGPTDLESALIKVYNRKVVEKVDPNNPFADIGDLAIAAMDNTEWEDLFDSAQELALEDSSVISQEMRDRPASGVFEVMDGEDEDDLPIIDIIDVVSPAKPVAPVSDPLDDWEVDDAITNSATNKVVPVAGGPSQIISAADAMNLFGDPVSPPAASTVEPPRTSPKVHVVPQAIAPGVDDDVATDDDVGEPTEKKSLSDLSTDSEGMDNTGKTSLGVGVGAQEDSAAARASLRAPKAKTAHTDRLKRDTQGRRSDTDYGELGRQLLQSEIARDEAAAKESALKKAAAKEAAAIDADAKEAAPVKAPAVNEELIDEVEPTDRLVESTAEDATNLHLIAIPEDVDTRLLLRNLLSHLHKAGVLHKDVIAEMIRTARPKA